MKTKLLLTNRNQRGYALMWVMLFSGISMVVMGAALSWSSSTSNYVERHNEYYASLSAAEAASEKVLANISRDYQTSGESLVTANMDSYRNLTPTAAEHTLWSSYEFSDGQGNTNHTFVANQTNWTYQALNSQFTGLSGYANTFRIISNARKVDSRYDGVVGALKQEVQVATIPVFQFAIFYSMDCEIEPGAAMNIKGRVHGNAEIYLAPSGATPLTFNKDITAVGKINNGIHPLDPRSQPSSFNISYGGQKQSRVSSLTLPVGTNNSPATVYEIVNIPPTGEDINSPMGKQRYYNKADLIILVSNNTVLAKSGPLFSPVTLTQPQISSFVNTNVSFFNRRENATVKTTEIDVAKLVSFSTTNANLRPALGGRDIQSIYVADLRTQTTSTEPGIRLINGQTLPSAGLTVATPDPLYVKGHYNAPTAALGTTNTSATKPASLVSDAITVLSSSWNDTKSSGALSGRIASATTVNAALISGIVKTSAASYSGGVENFIRFLEDWGGKILTYNGSLVVMYESKIADGLWSGTGSTIAIYNPPSRNWSFDLNFLDAKKLPPGTPGMRAIVRSTWNSIAKNTTQ